MKKTLYNKVAISIIGCLFMVLGGLVAQGWALPLPSLDFQGSIYIDLDSPPISPNPLNTVKVTSYTDKDGLDSSLVVPTDPILDQLIWGFSFVGFNYDWQNDSLNVDPNATAGFRIGDSSDPYLTASAINIKVQKLGSREYRINALLINHTFYHTDDSHFMEQFRDAVQPTDKSQLITWDVVFDLTNVPTDYDYKVNVSGKLAPVPEPATILLFGTGLIGLAGVARKKVKKA